MLKQPRNGGQNKLSLIMAHHNFSTWNLRQNLSGDAYCGKEWG